MTDLVERLRPSREFGPVCPFCLCDPYHYVDNGLGMERVAVNCCDLAVGYFNDGDEQLVSIVQRMTEAADRIEQLKAEIARKDEALRECRRAVSGGREDPRRRVRDIVDLTLRKPTALEPTNEPA